MPRRSFPMPGIGAVLLLLGAACGRGQMQVCGPDASAVPDAVVAPDARDGVLDSAQVDPRSTDGQPADAMLFDLPAESTQPSCGNGSYDPSEECDDGNRLSGDGCSATCQLECGDAGVEPCIDPGFFPESPWYLCCKIPYLIVCGDGVLAPIEACDDGNTSDGDGCPGDCTTVERGYRCIVPGEPCTPICGDGEVKGGETCDDGNRNPGDGCSQFCLTELGWDCSTGVCVPRESNDGGWEVQEPALYCGDGIVSGAEECDWGLANGASDSVCSVDCAYLFCGDGIVTGSEECDLGRANGTAYGKDGCTSSCRNSHFCGDGIIDSSFGEECDTGDLNGGTPGGPSDCTAECKLLLDI